MAVIATRRACLAPVLVVCPSAALVEQLQDQFEWRFWDKIKATNDWRPDLVLQILPSQVDELAAKLKGCTGKRVIVVGTIQAVQQIQAEGNAWKLKNLVQTIIFDEGHREPAPAWADVVRGFAVPTVLFSATPFRGDMKIFNVDDNHIHFLSFREATKDRLIREVEIKEQSLSLDPDIFARQIVNLVDELVETGRFAAENKVIVRGASEDSVVELHQAFARELEGRDDGVLAIHHNFKKRNEPGLLAAVPRNIADRNERFLIHQFMLIEGIDDPACAMAALFEPFSNTRMLVQQIGRLIRHPGPIGERVLSAYVLGRQSDDVKNAWHSFLEYDDACVKNGGKPYIRNDAKILEELVKALPMLDYVAGKFRQRVDLEGSDIHSDLRFPRSAVVFDVDPNLDMEELQERISGKLSEEDRHQALIGKTESGNCRYHVSLRLNPSPFLAGSLFHGPSLEVTIYAKYDGRLFFYDSAGLWINEIEGIGPRVDPRTFRSLMPDGGDNVISFINVKNTDLGPLALRSRSLSARSLERSGVFLGEHMNVVTRATGRVEMKRRSVGFSNARVREGDGADATASEFASWCAAVNAELNAAARTSTIFSRFATPTDIPSDTAPVNILVDMLEVRGQFRTTKAGTSGIDTEDLCVDVEPDADPKAPAPHRFKLVVDGKSHDVWIEWNAKKKKYWLTSPGLSGFKLKDNEKISLTRRLNQSQPFRIITADMAHTYVNGAFYALDLNLASERGAGALVLDLITSVPGLAGITSEKGTLRDGDFNGWSRGSLFNFIDRALNPRRGPEIMGPALPNLVCDDLHDEVADFIGVDERVGSPRVTFVVGKWKAGVPGVSASAFYDVCAQGIKNLAYIKSDGTSLPGSQTRFDRKWRLSKDGITQTVDRRRAGVGSAAFRRLVQQMRWAPATERSIWLVCSGGMLSKNKLEQEFRAPQPKAHVLQFYHLVMSSYSACQSVGVNFRVFCAE